MTSRSFDHQHPLSRLAKPHTSERGTHRCWVCTYWCVSQVKWVGNWISPFVINGLDDEPKRWTDAVNVFSHNFLHYCRFACVVQTTKLTELRYHYFRSIMLTAWEFSSLCPSVLLFVKLKAFWTLLLLCWQEKSGIFELPMKTFATDHLTCAKCHTMKACWIFGSILLESRGQTYWWLDRLNRGAYIE
jgi:hypothetical protein